MQKKRRQVESGMTSNLQRSGITAVIVEQELDVIDGAARLLRRKVMQLATEVFGDPAIAKEWMETPNLVLGNVSPTNVLLLLNGQHTVETLLHRIDHGILA